MRRPRTLDQHVSADHDAMGASRIEQGIGSMLYNGLNSIDSYLVHAFLTTTITLSPADSTVRALKLLVLILVLVLNWIIKPILLFQSQPRKAARRRIR